MVKTRSVIPSILLVIAILTRNFNLFTSSPNDLTTSVNRLLDNYSAVLMSTPPLWDETFSLPMRRLVTERRNYYKDFYRQGLHADLLTLESMFIDDSIRVLQDNGVVNILAIEKVRLIGTPITILPIDYPLINAAKWAIAHTAQQEVKVLLEQYIYSMTIGIEQSVKNGVETNLLIYHELEMVYIDGSLQISKDNFTDSNADNEKGFDTVTWEGIDFYRNNVDWRNMLDYQIYNISVSNLGESLLTDFELVAANTTYYEHFPDGSWPTLRYKAVEYIGKFTSSPNYTHYVPCGPNVSSVLQDTYYYNKDFKNIWETTGCNDCTDYVSQALYFSFLPSDATHDWKPDPYSTAWNRTYTLSTYLENFGYGSFVGHLITLQEGDLAFRYKHQYEDEVLNWQHVVMVSGINPHKYSAHTNDRYNSEFSETGTDINKFMVIIYPRIFYFFSITAKGNSTYQWTTVQPYPSPMVTSKNSNPYPYP